MPARPESDWTQTGWKIWGYDGTDIWIYSSNTHTWDQVPQNGAQMMFRFYTKGQRNWREMISGQDFYLENDTAKELLPRVTDFFKIGSLDNDHFHTALEALRADNKHSLDNSIDKYIDTKKKLIGWKAWVVENNKLTAYASDTSLWAEVPTFGMLMMNKYYQSGQDSWIENITNQDLYYLDSSDEDTLKSTYDFLKNGSVVPIDKLEEIHQLLIADAESF